MNLNILAYGIYLTIMVFIIVVVGKAFHKNGRIFILALFRNDVAQTDNINNILLLAYYLFNIGYAFMKLRWWQPIHSIDELIASISSNVGLLVLILAVTHYFNMLLIRHLSNRRSYSLTDKIQES